MEAAYPKIFLPSDYNEMATYKLQHFSQLDVLKRLNPENLLMFLRPFKDFFTEQGLKLPRPDPRGGLTMMS